MIRISLGSVGSGKSACEVRELLLNKSMRTTYTNIIMKKPKETPNVKLLNHNMILKQEIVDTKVNKKTGESTPVYELKLNTEFWKSITEPINVLLDEAHTILNSRRSMSKVNVVMGDWLALIRRVLGASDSGMGELVFITQLPNRIDTIAREMALQIRYHVCHFEKRCPNCGYGWRETSESPEPLWRCPSCGSHKICKQNHQIQVWHFRSMGHFHRWKLLGEKTYHSCYLVKDIEKYFPYYDTLQWDNMFSEFY